MPGIAKRSRQLCIRSERSGRGGRVGCPSGDCCIKMAAIDARRNDIKTVSSFGSFQEPESTRRSFHVSCPFQIRPLA